MEWVYALGEQLEEVPKEQAIREQIPSVFLTDSENYRELLEEAGICYEGEAKLSLVSFCRVETQQECICGSLAIPRLSDIQGIRSRLLFFVSKENIVIADDGEFARALIERIQEKKIHQGDTKEKFLYNFMAEFMSKDMEFLSGYEKRIIEMEEDIIAGRTREFQKRLMPIRKELLNLRGYYDELSDMGDELESDENDFLEESQQKYFGIIAGRANRLLGRTVYLLEYAQQIKEACQAQIDARQNRNMQYLTMITTIFFPLTLITGWYGMNFRNMPELENGYPGVILLSLAVLIACILFFRKKKIL